MNQWNALGVTLLAMACVLLTACTPVKTPIKHQYQLTCYSHQKLTSQKTTSILLVTKPEAMPGYQTEQMLYVANPYERDAFAYNAWVSSPANMLYPLLLQSIQSSGYFAAVASGSYADNADYRLDTQIIQLQQNFLIKPSVLELAIKVMLTQSDEGRLIASRTFYQRVPCLKDTPRGGVVAANQATANLTKLVTKFLIHAVKQDKNTVISHKQ